ncbi:MAG: hypothetical protein FWD48_04170 [Oscillospiraceae bacterium]|nr:hypothetical protein [Oscillospiraceae bacterium]
MIKKLFLFSIPLLIFGGCYENTKKTQDIYGDEKEEQTEIIVVIEKETITLEDFLNSEPFEVYVINLSEETFFGGKQHRLEYYNDNTLNWVSLSLGYIFHDDLTEFPPGEAVQILNLPLSKYVDFDFIPGRYRIVYLKNAISTPNGYIVDDELYGEFTIS